MAVRRELLIRFIDGLDLTSFRLLDALAFFSVLASPASLRLDPLVLTEYRVHGQNSSVSTPGADDPLVQRAAFSRLTEPSRALLIEAARRTGGKAVIEEAMAFGAVQRAYAAMRGGSAPRGEFSRLRRELARYGACYMVRSEVQLRWALRLFSAYPALGRRMYARQVRVNALAPGTPSR